MGNERNIDALLKELDSTRLCKVYKEYSGSNLIREYIAHPQLAVGGYCIKKSYVHSGTKLLGENCVVDLWTQTMEDTINSPTDVFVNTSSTIFDGVDEYIDFGDTFSYDRSQAFSISLWVKPQNVSAQRVLFSKTTIDANVRGYVLYHNSSGALYLQMRTNTSLTVYTFATSTLVASTWQHVVMTYSGGSNINGTRVYIDGTVGATPSSQSLGGSWLEGQSFFLGKRSSSFFYSGTMDEFTVWDKELSQLEVTELYNAGVPTNPVEHSASANLVTFTGLDSHPTATDLVSSNDGTLTNMNANNIVQDVPE